MAERVAAMTTKDDLPPLPEPDCGLGPKAHWATYSDDAMHAYAMAAIAAHDSQREKVLLVRELDLHHKWHVASPVEVEGTRLNGLQYRWAYIEREGA